MTKKVSKLSTNLQGMKFMRRTKQRIEEKEKKKQESELEKAYLAGETIAEGDRTCGDVQSLSSDRFLFSSKLMEDLQYGRMSFNGCNPQVEILMKYFTDKKNGTKTDSDDEKDVSDNEMADTMGGSLSRTIGGKIKTKAMKRDALLIDESTGDAKGKKRRHGNGRNKKNKGKHGRFN